MSKKVIRKKKIKTGAEIIAAAKAEANTVLTLIVDEACKQAVDIQCPAEYWAYVFGFIHTALDELDNRMSSEILCDHPEGHSQHH